VPLGFAFDGFCPFCSPLLASLYVIAVGEIGVGILDVEAYAILVEPVRTPRAGRPVLIVSPLAPYLATRTPINRLPSYFGWWGAVSIDGALNR
jgi:hypothetical protein